MFENRKKQDTQQTKGVQESIKLCQPDQSRTQLRVSIGEGTNVMIVVYVLYMTPYFTGW